MIGILVEAALRSCALALALWLILTLTRSRNPYLHKLMWSVVLIAALAMPLLMQIVVLPAFRAPAYVLTLEAGTPGIATPPSPWSVGAVGYFLVAMTLLSRGCTAFLRMWLIRRDALHIDRNALARLGMPTLDVRTTTRLRSPCTFGGTVLLPACFVEWAPRKLMAVLAHEHSHVLHKDCYLLWLSRLHTCVFWFSPLAWWTQRRLAQLSETTSDEAAVTALGDRPEYAEILLDFARLNVPSEVATAMARAHVSSRIERIISDTAPSAAPALLQRMWVIGALLPVVAAAAAPVEPNAAAAPVAADQESQQPSIKQGIDTAELMKYYPREALRKGIDGVVQLRMTLDAQGRPADTLILTEDPRDMGFGAAALAIARALQYNNPAGRPAQFSFKVQFALPAAPGSGSGGTTLFEAPQAQRDEPGAEPAAAQ